MTAATVSRAVPELGPDEPVAVPPMSVGRLPSGLRLVVVEQPGTPLVELRLRIPLPLTGPGSAARKLVLTQTMLTGTRERDHVALAEHLEDVGARLTVDSDPDALVLVAAAPPGRLDPVLDILSEVLTGATYPDAEVEAATYRLRQKLTMAGSQASVRARQTLQRHLFGEHPYGTYLPTPDDVGAVTGGDVRDIHRRHVVPDRAVMVLVGDIDAPSTIDAVHAALAGWNGSGRDAVVPAVSTPVADPSLLVHRPGSVQSSIRIGGPALRRDHPDYPALLLANLIYGGYFSSRLVGNIREDKGFTYTPRSHIEHGAAGSTLVVEADVATEVTAPALLEIWYELGRLSTRLPTGSELDDVRRYATGTLAMSIATPAGLASTLVTVLGAGLAADWLCEQPQRLASVTAADIYRVGVHILAPCRLAAVVIGDATLTAEPLKAFGPWEIT